MATAEAIGTGISFALTDEQRALRELAHEFAEKEIRPKAAEYDEDQTHPADVIAKAHELGLMNLHVPEARRPRPRPSFEGMLIAEELYWGCSGIGTALIGNGLGARPADPPAPRSRSAVAAAAVEGPMLCSFALTEPERRLGRLRDPDDGRPARRRVRPQRLEDVHHERGPRRRGSIVFASTDRSGRPGPHGFVVPMDAEGGRGEHLDKMGQRATETSAFALRSFVPVANRLGAEGDGFKIAMRTLDGTRPGTAIGAVGVARAAFEHACEYAKERSVRAADRDAPGRQLPDRRHGDGDRGGAAAHLAGGVDARPRRARRRSTRRWRSASRPTRRWR